MWRNLLNEYSGAYKIRWSDLDTNGYVNYAAYIDAAGDLRYRFFTEHGFPPERFEQLGIGLEDLTEGVNIDNIDLIGAWTQEADQVLVL